MFKRRNVDMTKTSCPPSELEALLTTNHIGQVRIGSLVFRNHELKVLTLRYFLKKGLITICHFKLSGISYCVILGRTKWIRTSHFNRSVIRRNNPRFEARDSGKSHFYTFETSSRRA